MPIPIVGLLSALCAALGLYGLWWYHGLDEKKRKEADRYAAQLAWNLFNRTLDQLNSQQMRRVVDLVKSRFAA